jgi:hypothetical protein
MRKILLSDEQESKIKKLYHVGRTRKSIAKEMNISEWVIKRVVTNSDPNRLYKYTGKRFGKLIVLRRIGTAANNAPTVECQCDCGNIKNFIITNLTGGGTVSCGCYNRDKAVSKNPWPTELKLYIRQEQTNRGNIFSLTLEDFKTLCSSDCFYCKAKPNGKMQVGREKRNGIDRIDNSIGYRIDNCVSCCWTCNRMKGTMSHIDFLAHVKKIAVHNSL